MNRAAAPSGFTLIELLVVIAIIGILSSVILSALNSARIKGQDAAIKENVSTAVTQAGLDYDGNGNSYGTEPWTINMPYFTPRTGVPGASAMFDDRTIGLALSQAAQMGGALSYGANKTSWIIVSRLKGGGYWCVDSSGQSKLELESSGYVRPTIPYNYGGSPTTSYSCL